MGDVQWPADAVMRQSVASLIPYARNSRVHSDTQVAQLAASIREWGWTVPVLIDEEGGIIAGHGRVLAARVLGLDEIPVMIAAGWSEAQKRAYIIADNKLPMNASWDEQLLRVEIGDLKTEGFDLALVGFSDLELGNFLAIPEEKEPPKEFATFDENVKMDHVCPKCGYAFSGGKTVPRNDEMQPDLNEDLG